jgi:hypothetical protein
MNAMLQANCRVTRFVVWRSQDGGTRYGSHVGATAPTNAETTTGPNSGRLANVRNSPNRNCMTGNDCDASSSVSTAITPASAVPVFCVPVNAFPPCC